MKKKELYIGLLIGFFIGLLALKMCNTTKIEKPIIISTKEIKDSLRIDTIIPTIKIDSLNIINKKLKQEQSKLKFDLQLLKDNSLLLEQQVRLLEQDNSEESNSTIEDYISLNKSKDSTYDTLISKLEQESKNKDSIIIQKDTLINIQKRYLTLSLNQQDKLLDYSKQLKKEITKQKTNNILWKAGTIIVAGLIIKQQLKK